MVSYLALVVVLAVTLGVGLPIKVGRARDWRWGTRQSKPFRAGTSPYREGLAREDVPRGAPWRIRFIAGANAFWGTLSTFVLAPGTFVSALLVAGTHTPISTLVLLAVSLSALGLGAALIAAGDRLLDRRGLERAMMTAQWSLAHHAAMAAALAIAFPWHWQWAPSDLLVVVPSLIGGVLALGLYKSTKHALQLET